MNVDHRMLNPAFNGKERIMKSLCAVVFKKGNGSGGAPRFHFRRAPLILALFTVFILKYTGGFAEPAVSGIPEGFVDIKEAIPSIVLDIRYYSTHNFVGKRIDGYSAPKCYLTKKAAAALKKVQEDLNELSLSLKVYDGYRPQKAVNHFVSWAKDTADIKTKGEFYPTINKKYLFRDGYIASRSGHSRGSSVDLTIVPIPLPEQEPYVDGEDLCACYLSVEKRYKDNTLDMGTGFDCFHTASWTASNQVGAQQRANRLLLKTLMEKHGFKNYEKEWWHFTLKNEPFPKTYFDFPVK